MAMDLAALRVELYGAYSYLNDGGAQATRSDRWINQSYHELCDEAPWPFLEATTTGAAPLTVATLGEVLSVTDSAGGTLHPIQEPTLHRAVNTLLSQAGSAGYYYVTGGTVVNTYPTATTSITVRYAAVPTDLSAGTDVPLVPDRYRDIIAIGALRRAAIDNQAWQAAGGYKQEWNDRLAAMLSAEIEPPRYQQIVAGSEDQ